MFYRPRWHLNHFLYFTINRLTLKTSLLDLKFNLERDCIHDLRKLTLRALPDLKHSAIMSCFKSDKALLLATFDHLFIFSTMYMKKSSPLIDWEQCNFKVTQCRKRKIIYLFLAQYHLFIYDINWFLVQFGRKHALESFSETANSTHPSESIYFDEIVKFSKLDFTGNSKSECLFKKPAFLMHECSEILGKVRFRAFEQTPLTHIHWVWEYCKANCVLD